MATPYSYSTKIAGVTFDNPNGTSRQSLIQGLRKREQLKLVDCSSTEYPEAIGVFNMSSEQLGFLPKEDARLIRILGKDINSLVCLVRSVGRTNVYKPYGVQIVIGESYQAASEKLNELEKPQSYSYQTPSTNSYSYSSMNTTNTKNRNSGCASPIMIGIIITVAVLAPILYVVFKVINFFK